MNIFRIELAANEVREAALLGEYLEVRSQIYPVAKIELTDKNGAVVNTIVNALESDFVRDRYFERMVIENGPTPQTVSFWYGEGEAGSRRFSGNVTGTVALDVATLAALETTELGAATLAALETTELGAATLAALGQPLQATNAYAVAATAMVANTAVQVFAPGSNPNGAILLSASATDQSGAAGIVSLLSKASQPASVVDGDVYMALDVVNAACRVDLKGAQKIPPGHGLYFISSGALGGVANQIRACRYRLL